jgi:hypothetical protein
MGLGSGLVDFIGGAAEAVKSYANSELQNRMQTEADERKAKMLAKLQQETITVEQGLVGGREKLAQETRLKEQEMQSAGAAEVARIQAEQRAATQRDLEAGRNTRASERNKALLDMTRIQASRKSGRAASRREDKEESWIDLIGRGTKMFSRDVGTGMPWGSLTGD